MRKILICLSLICIFQVSSCNVLECSEFFIPLNTSNPNFNSLLSNSAKRAFDMGLYDSCLKQPNFHYLAIYTYNPLMQLTTGVCMPAFCSADDINTLLRLFSIPGIDPSTTVAIDPASLSYDFGGGSIAVSFILALLVAMVLIGPIYKTFRNIFKSSLKNFEPLLDDVQEERPQETLIEATLNAFSLELNVKKLFTIREGKLDFFNCLRALSLFYVIFGHEFILRFNQSINPADINDMLTKPLFLLIAGAFYAVDVFYYLSGFFLAFVLIQENSK